MAPILKQHSFSVFLLASLLVGCIEGERGPAGPMGEIGEKGDPGPMGERGEPGMDGKNADPTYRPVSLADCAVTLDIVAVVNDTVEVGQDGVSETGLRVTIKTYSNGDVDVSCLAVIGSGGGGSGSAYHLAGTTGAIARACGVAASYPVQDTGGSVGSWRFTVTNGKLTAQYADAGNPLDGQQYEFSPDKCIARTMGEDGTWSDAMLEDVLK